MAKEGKRFLIVIELAKTDVSRLQELVPRLQTQLTSLSTKPVGQAFRSVSADIFGFVIRSKLAARQICAAIESPQKDQRTDYSITEPFLDGDDHLLVIELGDDFITGKGFTRLGTWLQHH